ncbi:hypothetical protein RHS01_07371 [Rhizoctonia solani]|uniref:Reverse transcriptase n=1 Tax=Rhizoctonia solani TaxID=456999 RepID=A0A8H7IA95_9AGAM|nr:hypothetical protein RHS01_07371 [Rhizoctonia solani]
MSRVMRSGRTYDPGQAPAAPKRRGPKSVSTMGTKTSERQGEYENDEGARLITFGSIPGTETLEGSLVLKGTGKRKGVSWTTSDGVKLSPAAYKALTNKAPPIRRKSNLRIEYPQDTRETADARNDTDASDEDNGDAAPQETTARTADRALGVPTTLMLPTVRPSGDEESAHEKPQYVIVDDSPSHAYKHCKGQSEVNSESDRKSEPVGISWFEEMRKAENLPEEEELPELDATGIETTGLDRSTSRHLILSPNDMLTDEEYERLLEMLRNQERLRTAREYEPSQTSGAGPSGARRTPPVTLEEVEDEGERVHRVVSSDEERESEYELAPKGKGKRKGRIEKNRPRTSLGVIIDEVQRDPVISYTERVKSQSLRESQPANHIPEGFSSGGYAQAMYGTRDRDRSSAEARRSRRVEYIAAIDKPRSDPSRPVHGSELRSERSEPRLDSQRDGDSRNSRNYDPSESGRQSRRDERPDPAGTPSDPDDDRSESSSSSSSDSESSNNEDEPRGNPNRQIMKLLADLKKENKKLKRKMKDRARSGYKAQTPKTYKGEEPDIEAYEQFLFEYNTWIREAGLSRDESVRGICRFLDGKASKWYMSKIAPNLDREKLRKKYESLTQGERVVQDFFADLELYRTRLSDVTDSQHVRRAWNGAARYIRVEWAIRGIRPESTTIEELKRVAEDIERAYKEKRAIEHDSGKRENHKRERSRSPNRKRDHKGNNSQRNGSFRDQRPRSHQGSSQKSHGRDRAENWKKHKQVSSDHRRDQPLTKEEKEKLKAEGKCFLCKQTGHFTRNCPKSSKATPSGLKVNSTTVRKAETRVMASSVLLRELDKLSKFRNELELRSAEVEVCAAQPSGRERARKVNKQGYIERNAMRVRDNTRKVPQTITVQARLNGQTVRVLLDWEPLQLVLAISGSKGVVNYATKARLQYQDVDEEREFDVGNLGSYDIILGTPWLYQHSVSLSFNPMGVSIGSARPLPLEGDYVLEVNSLATDVFESRLEELRVILRKEAEILCPESVASTPLPPFRAINHTIPLKDETRVYKFRPSRCPEKLKPLFEQKAREYLDSGRWQLATGSNAIPMLFLPKKKLDGEIALRTVLDKREQNDNTVKLASPLPLQDEILLKVSAYLYKSVLDGKDAYEQIRVEEKDVHKTLFHTPLGTMISKVMQQGDCNAGATYQQLMNHLFSAHIGVFMYVYLDDIIIFSNTIEEHVEHIRVILKILGKEKFYLSPKKMQFFTKEINLLGHVIDSKGIKMDPHKVDSIEKWKTPVTKEQIASYIGALGYLAPNCEGIRKPMAILSKCASGTGRFIWEGTQERAFKETKQIVAKHRNTHRKALDYSEGAPTVFLITDASLTGASGVLSQGVDWKQAGVIAFWSGKFDPAQQNYPVHDREALAIMLSLKKFEPMLQGVHFRILTDHWALEHLTSQKNLNQRQMRWIDLMSRFDFRIVYIEGTENVLADALSRMYSAEEPGVERARIGVAAAVAATSGTNSAMVRRNPTRARNAPKRYDPVIPGREGDGSTRKKGVSTTRRVDKTRRNKSNDTAANAAPEGKTGPESNFETQIPEIVKSVNEIDVLTAIRKGYAKDKHTKRTTVHEDNDEMILCIPECVMGEYDVRPLLIAQAHSVLAHQGYQKTYAYMRESVWWKNMAKEVERFCRACTTCTASKQSTQHPYGLLKPLQVPKFPWSQIGIDFVGPLPSSKTLYGEFDMICVVVDHLTSMTHLIASRQDYTARDIAKALHAHVFKLHGPPDIIISDRDKLFTSEFHKTINELSGTELGMSTSNHPETDGLVERGMVHWEGSSGPARTAHSAIGPSNYQPLSSQSTQPDLRPLIQPV